MRRKIYGNVPTWWKVSIFFSPRDELGRELDELNLCGIRADAAAGIGD